MYIIDKLLKQTIQLNKRSTFSDLYHYCFLFPTLTFLSSGWLSVENISLLIIIFVNASFIKCECYCVYVVHKVKSVRQTSQQTNIRITVNK